MNLYQKINNVMKEVRTVEKGAKVSMGNSGSYMAVSHDDVTRLLHMPVANAGIVLASSVISSSIVREAYTDNYGKEKTQFVATVTIELTAINADDPTERLHVQMPAVAFDNGDKAAGKAISMATKYAYLKLFMLESIDEEEQRNDYHAPPRDTRKLEQSKPQLKPQEKPKTIVQNAKDDGVILAQISERLSALTVGKTKDEKAKYMQDRLGIKSYGDLMAMDNIALVGALAKLS